MKYLITLIITLVATQAFANPYTQRNAQPEDSIFFNGTSAKGGQYKTTMRQAVGEVTKVLHIEDYHPAGDGVTDDYIHLQAMLNDLKDDYVADFGSGQYYTGTTLVPPSSLRVVRLKANYATLKSDTTSIMKIGLGAIEDYTSLSISLVVGVPYFTIPNGVTLEVGDVINLFVDNDTGWVPAYWRGVLGQVVDISGNTAYLDVPPPISFTATHITKYDDYDFVHIAGLIFDQSGVTSSSATAKALQVWGAGKIVIEDNYFHGADKAFVGIDTVGNSQTIQRNYVEGFLNTGGTPGGSGSNRSGYGITAVGSNIIVENNTVNNCKHNITAGTNRQIISQNVTIRHNTVSQDPAKATQLVTYDNGTGTVANLFGSVIDYHANAVSGVIENNNIYGLATNPGYAYGNTVLSVRSPDIRITNNVIRKVAGSGGSIIQQSEATPTYMLIDNNTITSDTSVSLFADSTADSVTVFTRTNKLTNVSTSLTPVEGNVVGPGSSANTALVRWSGTGGKTILDSSITSDGSSLVLPNSSAITLSSSGTDRSVKLTNTSVLDSLASVGIVPASGTNTAASLQVSPKGTGLSSNLKSQITAFNTDLTAAPNDYGYIKLVAGGNYHSIQSGYNGSATPLPIYFQTHGSNTRMVLSDAGGLSLGTTTDPGAGNFLLTGTISDGTTSKTISTIWANGWAGKTFADVVNLFNSASCIGFLKSDGTCSTAGEGTVTSVSVVSANGLQGSVNTSTTTPAITLQTSVSGLLMGSVNAIVAANASSVIAKFGGGSCSGYLKSDGSCNTPGGGNMTNTGASVANQIPKYTDTTGIAIAPGYTVGTGVNNLVQLDGSAKLPPLDGSQLINLPLSSYAPLNAASATGAWTFAGGLTPYIATGTNRNLSVSNASTGDNYASFQAYPSSGTNVGASVMLIPKGTGYSSSNRAQFSIYNTDFVADSTNYEQFVIIAGGTWINIRSNAGGTGTIRPLRFQLGGVAHTVMSDRDLQLNAHVSFMSNSSCTSSSNPYTCCTGSGTGTCLDTPTVSSCGTSPTIAGNNSAGKVTIGATGTACTLTFVQNSGCTSNTTPWSCCTGSGTGTCGTGFTSAPACIVNGGAAAINTTTTSALSITAIAGTYSYHCLDY